VSKIGVSTHVRTLELVVIADLDTLLIALYVELTDRIVPSLGTPRRGPGRPPVLSDAELVCLAVAQVLLRCDDERRWLRAAPARVGHLVPRLGQFGLDRHGGRVPAGLWTRVVQRLLALNVAIWHNWVIGAAVKRSLIAYDH
jgi:hypothetical protein